MKLQYPTYPPCLLADRPDQPRSRERPVRFAASGRGLGHVSLFQTLRLSGLNRLVKIFQPVLEVFFWGIMVLDVCALWAPRIGNSLTVGAFEYKPKEDPSLKGKTGWDRFKHVTRERFKRLNWINFLEELWREAASGPAIFVGPTLVFLLARRTGDKTGIELGRGPLNALVDTFSHQIQKKPVGTSEEQFKAAMKTLVSHLFGETEFATKTLKDDPHTTYREAIDRWSARWVETVFQGRQMGRFDFQRRNAHEEKLDGLKKELMDLVQTFNREHQSFERAYAYERTPIVWLKSHPNKRVPQKEMIAAETVFDNLMKWKDFAFNVLKESTRYTEGVTPRVLDQARQRLKLTKAVASIVSILATLTFLFKLVVWAQSHNKYPAYRLVNEDTPTSPQAPLSYPGAVPAGVYSLWPLPKNRVFVPQRAGGHYAS